MIKFVMKLTKLKINELKDLYDLLIAQNDYIARNLRLTQNDIKNYSKWRSMNIKIQEKLKMVYNEINNRIEYITE